MTAQQIYEKETGNEAPGNQIAHHEWHIKYVSWLERRVEKNHYTMETLREDIHRLDCIPNYGDNDDVDDYDYVNIWEVLRLFE